MNRDPVSFTRKSFTVQPRMGARNVSSSKPALRSIVVVPILHSHCIDICKNVPMNTSYMWSTLKYRRIWRCWWHTSFFFLSQRYRELSERNARMVRSNVRRASDTNCNTTDARAFVRIAHTTLHKTFIHISVSWFNFRWFFFAFWCRHVYNDGECVFHRISDASAAFNVWFGSIRHCHLLLANTWS